MSTATIYPFPVVDQPMYNNSGAAIAADRMVMSGTPLELGTGINPFTTDPWPLSTTGTSLVIPITIATASGSGDGPACGATIAMINDGEWGMVRTYGPAYIPNVESLTDANLTAYGNDAATNGYLAEVTAGASIFTVAFQIGASGVTTTNDPRKVFLLCDRSQKVNVSCEFGIFI